MRAVNLIPAEARRGSDSTGRTGSAPYVVTGALVIMALMMLLNVKAGNSIKYRKAEVAKVKVEAITAEAQAAALKPYADFASVKAARVQTVQSLANSRFKWERTLDHLARVIPKEAWITTFSGTVAPGVSAAGGGGSPAAGAATGPTISLGGCAKSQVQVARMISRMGLIEGVTDVLFEKSERGVTEATSADAPGAGASSDAGPSAGPTDCRAGHPEYPEFSLKLLFENTVVAPASPAAPATPATPTTPAPPAGGATPAANGEAGTTPPASTSPAPAAGSAVPAGGSAPSSPPAGGSAGGTP